MAATEMLTGNALTLELWEKTGWLNVGQKSAFGRMMDSGAVYFPEEMLGKDARGDQITYDYINRMTGNPIGEGGVLDGNEKALDLGSFSLSMNVTRDAVLFPADDTIEQQRTKIQFENAAKEVIPTRVRELIDASCFQHLAGVNPTSMSLNGTTYSSAAQKLHVQGHNTPVAPSSDRILRAAAAATDQALTSSDTMTVPLIDYALELNAASEQPIEPLDDGTFDLYLSPYDVVNLRHDSSSAIQWHNIELSRTEGGNDVLKEKFGNKLRMVGQYGCVNIIEAPRVAYGANSSSSAVITTVRRNVLVGKNALTFASPMGGRPSDAKPPYKIIDQLKDYGEYKGVGFKLIYGLKKTQPSNGSDIGVIVIGTYAAAHT